MGDFVNIKCGLYDKKIFVVDIYTKAEAALGHKFRQWPKI
ncbi:hypothetical protein PAU_01353 [Photorhabdus asymbiotica]|uniref:Uncharacterized protein n=1 Tax=Photorhabdus asymbiotica subsp. asymbiotica (strain ATCC 43949 / 3105-77) TaxID=553480 RepID=C7BSE2_PHOAA|nr:hypothetical protein PAU_01353 [Photorhabdus asymbiotica]